MSRYAAIYEAPAFPGDNWSAYAPDLPGLGVAGATLDECRARMATGIAVQLAELKKLGLPIPEPSTVAETLEIAA